MGWGYSDIHIYVYIRMIGPLLGVKMLNFDIYFFWRGVGGFGKMIFWGMKNFVDIKCWWPPLN